MRTFTGLSLLSGVAVAAALAGCAGSSSNGTTGPGVRALNGISTVPFGSALDGTYVLSTQLPYATVSGTPQNPYTIVPLGQQTVTFANAAAASKPIVSTPLTINNVGQHVTELYYNAAVPTVLTLIDNFIIPSTANVRFVNASSATGAVDFVLGPPAGAGSAPVFSLAPGQVGPAQPGGSFAYQGFNISGAYSLQVFPAGHDSGTPLVSQIINLSTSTAFTIVLLDPISTGSPPVLAQLQDSQLYDSAP